MNNDITVDDLPFKPNPLHEAILNGKAKMYWSTIDNPKATKGQKNHAFIELHKLGQMQCDSELCGRCNPHLMTGSRSEVERVQSEI